MHAATAGVEPQVAAGRIPVAKYVAHAVMAINLERMHARPVSVSVDQ